MARNSWEGEAKKESLLQYCKQMCISKTSNAMTMKPHKIDRRGYKEGSASIT
jgi:hypothetical protein